MTHMKKKPSRSGFTLIELLVAIALLLVLAGMAVLFVPGINEQARASRGAVNLQGWLNIAKQRALRDQAPRGVRLVRSKIDPNLVVDCFYIEQPDDFSGGRLATAADGAINVTITGGLDLYNNNPLDQSLWDVQPGDYLEINGGGMLRRIVSITSSTTFTVDPLNPITYKIESTPTYRIIRTPRILGDEKLQMPTNTAIDLKTNADFNNPLPPGPGGLVVDILFAPSGQIITPGVTTDTLNLWVRDTADVLNTDPTRGEPSIIAVFVRTGMVAPFNVGPLPTPYSLVK